MNQVTTSDFKPHQTDFSPLAKDYIKTLLEEGRDTKRKQLITVNKALIEIGELIDHCQLQIEKNGFAWYLGERYFKVEEFVQEFEIVSRAKEIIQLTVKNKSMEKSTVIPVEEIETTANASNIGYVSNDQINYVQDNYDSIAERYPKGNRATWLGYAIAEAVKELPFYDHDEVKENAILIAQFEGYKTESESTHGSIFYSEDNERTAIDTAYHISWDWLMPVIFKIKQETNFNVEVSENQEGVFRIVHKTDPKIYDTHLIMVKPIISAYTIIVVFLRWYKSINPNEFKTN